MTVHTLILCIMVFATLMGALLVYLVGIQEPSFNQKMLMLSAICSFIGVVAYLLELCAETKDGALIAARMGYVGKSFVMVFFLMFVTRYCNIKLPQRLLDSMIGISFVMMGIILTAPKHKLYYTSIDFEVDGDFKYLVLGKGIFYYVFIFEVIAIIITAVIMSLWSMKKASGTERKKLALLAMAGVLPVSGLVLNFIPSLNHFDTTPIGMMLAILLVGYNIIKFGLLDTMQLAGTSAINNVDYGLIVVSRGLVYLHANAAAQKMFPELAGNIDEKNKKVTEIFGGIKDNFVEKKVEEKDGRILEYNYSELNETSRGGVVTVNGYMVWIFDMTEEYEHTRELERLRDDAEAANHAKTMFLANMSHEIRTPMNGIMGFAELALENEMDDETKGYVGYIKQSAESLLGIINDVLDISRIESGKLKITKNEYNPHKLLEQVNAMILNQATEKALAYKAEIDSNLPTVLYGDDGKIREIVINILSNAIKYTKQGSVTLRVGCNAINDDNVVLEMQVEDTGVGISKQMLDRVFDTFERADNTGNYKVEGTGLGLSIAKAYAVHMGGDITVTSELGKGSVFTVKIPQKRIGSTSSKTNASKNSPMLKTNDAKALVVDDNVINIKLESDFLKRFGMEVDAATSGDEAIEKSEISKYDIILMDHMMPGKDGVETFEHIRSHSGINQDTPIILVTANAMVGVQTEMMSKGFDGFVSKPIQIKLLEEEVRKKLPVEKICTDNDEGISKNQSEDTCCEEKDKKRLLAELEALGVNTAAGIDICGSRESYFDILEISSKSIDEKSKRLKEFFENEDVKNYTILVHSIKSSLANIGAVALCELAKKLEAAGNENNWDYVAQNTDELLLKYSELNEVLSRYFPEKMIELSTSGKTLSKKEFADIKRKLMLMADELELDSMEQVVMDALKCSLDKEVEQIFVQIKNNIDVFDVEEIKTQIAHL